MPITTAGATPAKLLSMPNHAPTFIPLDLASWPRAQTYQHFRRYPCSFNLTAELDVTELRRRRQQAGYPFAPALIYSICQVVNRLPALRMAEQGGVPGYWQSVLPLYTVFHPATETFSGVWGELGNSLPEFCAHFAADVAAAQQTPAVYMPRPAPSHALNISIAPWQAFSAFELNLGGGEDYLMPIFTAGRFTRGADGQLRLPLAVRANHAACDGFHIAQFYAELQSELNGAENQR